MNEFIRLDIDSKLFFDFPKNSRCIGLFGWLHEHRTGSNRGICQWSAEKQIRRCIYPWQQCALHFNTKETSIVRIKSTQKKTHSTSYSTQPNTIFHIRIVVVVVDWWTVFWLLNTTFKIKTLFRFFTTNFYLKQNA